MCSSSNTNGRVATWVVAAAAVEKAIKVGGVAAAVFNRLIPHSVVQPKEIF